MDKVRVELDKGLYRQVLAMLEGRDLSDFLREEVRRHGGGQTSRPRHLMSVKPGVWPHAQMDALDYEDMIRGERPGEHAV